MLRTSQKTWGPEANGHSIENCESNDIIMKLGVPKMPSKMFIVSKAENCRFHWKCRFVGFTESCMHCRRKDYSFALGVTFDYFMFVQYWEIRGPAVSPYRYSYRGALRGLVVIGEYLCQLLGVSAIQNARCLRSFNSIWN